MPAPRLPAWAESPRIPRTKRMIWLRMSLRTRSVLPVTVASASYISAYQLIWFRRIVG